MDIKNPFSHPLVARQYKNPKPAAREILDKELVDQLIYSTTPDRDRLILELQARCGLRIGEALKLRAVNVSGRMLTIREPKSGKGNEIVLCWSKLQSVWQNTSSQTISGLRSASSPSFIRQCEH